VAKVEHTKQVKLAYDTLSAYYGDRNWWPAKTPYEVMVGAVLTQNTAWGNVEKAIASFGGNLLPETVINASLVDLAKTIHPSGFFNQKAIYLKALTEWFGCYDYDVATIQREPLEELRTELLMVKGVGKETADLILLYAFGFPAFVVDAYTIRLCERFPIDAGKGYDAVKAYFETNLPRCAEVYNNFHAMIVISGKDYCKKKPVCDSCPLVNLCRMAKL
jgi:endonuclease-3 related protein